MGLSVDELNRIRDRTDGWEEVWIRLWAELYHRLQDWVLTGPANEPLARRVNKKHFAVLRDPFTAEEFISYFLESLRRRAERGTLLAGFDPESGHDVCSYLIRVAPGRATSYIASLNRWESSSDGSQNEGSVARQRSHPDLDRCFAEIDHPPGQQPDVMVRQASMQVHPRLDREVPNWSTLQDHLAKTLQTEGHDTGLDHLASAHTEADDRLSARIDAIRLSTGGPKGSSENERQLDRWRADRMIAPLDGNAVSKLLAVSPVAARKQISRYRERRSLLRLFPRLRALVEQVDEGLRQDLLGDLEGADR